MKTKKHSQTECKNSAKKNSGLVRFLTASLFVVSSLFTATNLQAACVDNKFDNILETTPTSQFSLNSDGTATDNKTGLTWMRCSLGQTWDGATCTGTATTTTWQTALSLAESTTFAGSSNWRLPNIKELGSLIEETACGNWQAKINQTVFPNTHLFGHWSSTPDIKNSANAFILVIVYEHNTAAVPKNESGVSLRLVRSGQ